NGLSVTNRWRLIDFGSQHQKHGA
ncbi:hypothetical protein VCHENC02_5041B, partial [Vibrio harveyi]